MLSEKLFKQQLALLAENFNFQPGPEYIKLIYGAIKDKTADEILMKRAGNILLRKKLSDWNKDFGFGGKPAVADFIEMFCVKREEVSCKPYLEFGAYRSSKTETFKEAVERELKIYEVSALSLALPGKK